METIEIYGDGGCNNLNGVGGFGTVILYEGEEYQISKGYTKTTSNRMELMAIIEGLKTIGEGNDVVVYSDSRYVTNQYNRNWVDKWVRNNFAGKANQDLVKELYELVKLQNNVEFIWVKGHSGVEFNEICDELATAASKSPNKEVDTVNYMLKQQEKEFLQKYANNESK